MKILINYADKQYEPARKWNTLTGRYIARFDKVFKFRKLIDNLLLGI